MTVPGELGVSLDFVSVTPEAEHAHRSAMSRAVPVRVFVAEDFRTLSASEKTELTRRSEF